MCEVERDLTVPGDEVVFGGGKTVRDGMAQSSGVTNAEGALDLVITNAVVMDALLGIVKADIGVRPGGSSGSARPATRTSWTAWTRRWSSVRARR